MKKTKRVQIDSIDEFEDLTLFANESFDTGDVDLFEFSSEESSPLTRLKSTILSLDWEINDEILQELADEVANLASVYAGDKVAEVSKKWFRVRDTYGVEIDADVDPALILSITVAIDSLSDHI